MYYSIKFVNKGGVNRDYPIYAVFQKLSNANIKKERLIKNGMRNVRVIEHQEKPAGYDIIVDFPCGFAR